MLRSTIWYSQCVECDGSVVFMRSVNSALAPYGTTIFEVMSRLSQEEGAVNLGQGFPDTQGPEELLNEAYVGLTTLSNQYPPMRGLTSLRRAVASHNKRFYQLEVNPDTEVLITSGATEALAVCLLGLLNPGDEAVVLDPAYDSYRPIIQLAGAKAVGVALAPPSWSIVEDDLRRAISGKTKLLVVNSPMNPTGRVLSRPELDIISKVASEHDLFVVCDEVYEHLTFDGAEHIPLMTMPSMRDRTLRIGSAGKTFSMTGWKVGYVTGPKNLVDAAARAHQYVTFTTPPNLQHAVAKGLALPKAYFSNLSKSLEKQRDFLRAGLLALGLEVATCEGTYFLCANYQPLGIEEEDVAFSKRLTKEGKVATIPCSAFYPENAPKTWLRFAFCKKQSTLESALGNLQKYFSSI